MATTLYNVPETDLGLRYREPFISAGLNAKYQGVVPVGVYDGFAPEPGTALKLNLVPGASGFSTAVVTSALDATYQVSVRLAGAQALDLATFASKTVAITVEASYSFPSTTTGVIKAYDLSTETPPAYATVLAQVVVPASGVIPAANISLTGRTMPWDSQSRDGIPFISAIRDGSFFFSAAGAVPKYWESGGTPGTLLAAATTPASGYGNVVQGTAANTSAQNAYLRQYVGLPITENYGRVRLSTYYTQTVAPSSGNPALKAVFKTPNNNTAQHTVTLNLTVTGTAETFVDLADLIAMSARGAYLDYVEITFNGATYASSGPRFTVADVAVEVESRSGALDIANELTGTQRATRVVIVDPSNQSAANTTGNLTYDSASDTVTVANALAVTGTSAFTGATTHTGGIRTPTVDGLASGTTTLGIGTSSQTGLTMGRTGATTAITGSTTSVDANSTLAVGGTTQTGLTLGRAGATTTVAGSTTALGTGGSDGTITLGRSLSTTTLDSGTVNVGASGSGTTTVRSSALTVNGTENVVGNFSVNTSQFTVAASTGNTAVAGTLTVAGVINANGGIGRSTSGTLALGNDADVTAISIGTASSTGGVGISQSGQTTTIYGDLVVNGTASLGAVTISGIDSAAAGGTVTIGTTNASFVDIGNTANSTVTRVLGPIRFNDAGATASVFDRVNTGVLNIGASNATIVNVGRAPLSGGTATSIEGATVNVGTTLYTNAITVGSLSTSTAGITVGNAPPSGSVTTSVQGNTLLLGSVADNGIIDIGTSAPTLTRTISIGSSTGSQTVNVRGVIVRLGAASQTTTLDLGASTATTATLTLGNAPAGGTVNTYVRGNAIQVGTDSNTDSVTLGDGTSGTVRVNQYLDGNSGTLSLGTDTTRTTGLVLGRTPNVGTYQSELLGNTVYVGNSASTTAVNIGTTAPTTSRTLTVGYAGAAQTTTVNGGTINIGVTGNTNLDIGSNSTNIYLGYGATNDLFIGSSKSTGVTQVGMYAANSADTRIYGDEIYMDSPNTTKIVIGNSTAGRTRVNGYLDGNSSGLFLGTNTTATSGGVTVGNTSSTLSLQGAGISLGTLGGGNIAIGNASYSSTIYGLTYLGSGSLDTDGVEPLVIGGTNATTITLGRTGQALQVASDSLDKSTAATFSIGGTNATTLTLGRSGQALRVASDTIDKPTSSTLGIGTSLATTVTIGRAGQTVVFPGDVTLGGSYPFGWAQLFNAGGTSAPPFFEDPFTVTTVSQVFTPNYGVPLSGPSLTASNTAGTITIDAAAADGGDYLITISGTIYSASAVSLWFSARRSASSARIWQGFVAAGAETQISGQKIFAGCVSGQVFAIDIQGNGSSVLAVRNFQFVVTRIG